MMSKCIKAKNLKLRHSCIWMACAAIPIIPAIMGTFNYLNNLGLLQSEWYSLWTQITLFYSSLFYAPLIGLYCSYLWRLEHLNNNWNVLMTTPVPVRNVFLSKLAVVFKVTLLTQLWVGVLYFVCGKLCHLPGFIPLQILIWLIRGILAAAAVGTCQLLLSMVIRSFAVPIGIALAGNIIGFILSNKGLSMYWPYSVMLLGMNANHSEDSLQQSLIPFLISLCVFFLVFTGISIWYLKKKDVRA